jgi:hypothetical protein
VCSLSLPQYLSLLVAVEGEEVVQEQEDLSDEEADSAGCRSSEVGGWWVPAREVLAHDRAGWREGLKSLRVSECE